MAFKYGILIVSAAIILVYGLLKPNRNWDIVAYVAASYHKDGYRGAELASETYGEIKREVSNKRFLKLTTGEYREAVFKDPSSLEQQLPFYSIRIGYIELMRLLKRAGLSYTKSTYVISAIFAALSVVVLGLMMLRTAAPIGMLPAVVAVTGYTELASLSTPDAMACFFSLLGIYSLMIKGRLIFLVAAILPFIRTDLILLSGLLMIHTYLHGNRLASLFSILFAAACYVSINQLHGNYGYLTLFNFTFIGSLTPYPADITVSRQLGDYLIPYALLLNDVISHSHSVIYVLSLYLLWLKRGQIKDQMESQADFYCLFSMPFAFTVVHMLLFPSDQYRFFVFSASLLLVWSLGHLMQLTRK